MKIKKLLTENDNRDKQYNLTEIQPYQNNPNIKSFNKKYKKSKNAINFNNSFNTNDNGVKNFSLILKMLDEEVKKSIEYKKKINSLMKDLSNIKKENNTKQKNNQIFYQNFINIINNFIKNQEMINISFPNYSLNDEENKRNKNIIDTMNLLIKIIIDLCNNTNDNISKFNVLKNKINLFNESINEEKQKKINEMNSLKMQNNKLKKILEQNISFLNELREENNILKKRNLNLEKNLNLITQSSENMRKKFLVPKNIKYNQRNINRTYDDINDISIITNKTNKTNKSRTDILIEEFQDKEKKIRQLHKMAHVIYNNENNIDNKYSK